MKVPGVVTGPVLATMITCVLEELENTEWAARKAAADTLTCMANALGPSLNLFRAPCTTALQNCRFDKLVEAHRTNTCWLRQTLFLIEIR
jgi:hypothetical protein